MSKGIFITYIAFLLFSVTFTLAYIFSSENIELRSLSAKNSLSDKVYYTFRSIEDGVLKIIEKSLGNTTLGNDLNVTVNEQEDFSYITFVERLPQNVSDFNEDLSKYETFVETYLKERNLEIDSNLAGIGGTLTLLIEPYNITYTHDEFGKREVKIIPIDNVNSLGKLNEYNIGIQLINGWDIDLDEPPEWGPLKNDGLRINITTYAGNGTQTTTTSVFFDDFQSGFGKWTESNEFDWNIEGPAESQVPGKNSSNLVAHADACTSSTGCIITTTNPINLNSYNSATLKFWRYVDNNLDSGEFLKVEIYNGTSWNQIYYWSHGSGDDDTWHYEQFTLPNQYLISNFNLRFISKESSSSEETEIDDVLIEAITSTTTITKSITTNQTIDPYQKSSYTINTNRSSEDGFIKVIMVENPGSDTPGTLRISMQLTEAIVTIRLNLTDIPGKTKVDIPNGKINVVETLYDISKNDTASVI